MGGLLAREPVPSWQRDEYADKCHFAFIKIISLVAST